ncbi:MAG: addiction module protein [Roseateles sp.]|uniref:addiction module protein n=1 Tax=Roseateles sp. TaxID=1971397 RepID=UPI0039ECCAA5
MSTVEALQAQAEKLSPADRSRLLEHLVARLDADPAVEAAWDAVAEARQAELDAGTVKAVAYQDAVARLEARFPG